MTLTPCLYRLMTVTQSKAFSAIAEGKLSGMARPSAQPRRFAPLKLKLKQDAFHQPGCGDENQAVALPVLKGIVFDVDGTLCKPQTYMFAEMREALNISKQTDILTHIYSLPLDSQPSAFEAIRAIERRAMSKQTPQPGLAELMNYLDSRGIPKGICTRNFDAPVTHLLSTHLPTHTFHPIITRDFRPPKPDPAGILHIARQWGLKDEDDDKIPAAKELIMVGDSIDDMTAGRRAGAATVLLVNDVNRELVEHEHTDLSVERLDELVDILEHGFVASRVAEERGC